MPEKTPTLVIGAGLAGLACAVRLHEAGLPVTVLEASDAVGGRVRTDHLEGFLLDRGFQVYLDAYPEAGRLLNLEALDLRPFEPGALVWKNGKLRPVMDVFRRPAALFSSAWQPIGSPLDKLQVARLRWRLLRKPIDAIWRSPESSTETYLREFGFSDRMIDDFFRGFYGSIFLEDELATSSRMFEFTFKMFGLGGATLPAKGMQAIPEQIAARLPTGTVRLQSPVEKIEGHQVLAAGGTFDAEHIVVATDAKAARRWFPERFPANSRWKSTVCLYFSGDEAPFPDRLIVLKGDRRSGLINNLCVTSNIAPSYAPRGKFLVCVSILGSPELNADLVSRVREELLAWFGGQTRRWTLLRSEAILRALPAATPSSDPKHHPVRSQRGVHFCGDHLTHGSIEGAIVSGLGVADSILARS